MFLILQHVDGVLNYARLWKDTDLPYYGCHGPVAKGEEIHPVTLTRDLLNEPQEMGGAEGKVAWIGEFLPHIVIRINLTISRYRRHVSPRANCPDC